MHCESQMWLLGVVLSYLYLSNQFYTAFSFFSCENCRPPLCNWSGQKRTFHLSLAKKVASISSDGTVKIPTGSLGIPSKKKKKKAQKSQSAKLSKKQRQRTANGTIDSTNNDSGSVDPSQQGLQVVRGNRGNKVVTIIRGMNATSLDDKKNILKLLKSKLGTGGTIVDGVLELQGEKMDSVVEILKDLGYSKARKIGK